MEDEKEKRVAISYIEGDGISDLSRRGEANRGIALNLGQPGERAA